jgi:tripartite ATP-independent transporter DctM subunit
VLCLGLLVLLAIGAPISVAIGLSGVIFLVLKGYPLALVSQKIFHATDQFIFLAVPLFILAGHLMNLTGMSNRIIQFMQSLVGFIRGGLAMVNIAASMAFSGVSGAAVADTAALGTILIPQMEERGYSKEFSAAITSASSCIGPIIPPSIPLVIYGVIADTSIAELFLGGVIPGILIGLSLMIICYVMALLYGFPKEIRPNLKRIYTDAKGAFFALLMPFIILGGILFGIVTPTEASVIAVVYSFVVGVFVYKELDFKKIPGILVKTVDQSAIIVWLLGMATVVSWILSNEQIPQQLANWMISYELSLFTLLMLINILFLMVGMFLEPAPAMVMLVPIFLPIVRNLGMDPVHFGVVVVMNLIIGLLTPPTAPVLMVASSISGLAIGRLARATLPFILTEIAVLILVTNIPGLVMWIPLFYRSLQ